MAMDGDALGLAIWNELRPYYEWTSETAPSGWNGLIIWRKIANAVVAHIKNNAKAVGTDTPQGNSHNLSIV